MGQSFNKEINKNKNFVIDITTERTCYFPNDIIKGTISLTPVLNLNSAVDNSSYDGTPANLFIYQFQQLQCGKHVAKMDKKLTSKEIDLTAFKDKPLTEKIEFPFEIQLPEETWPTILTDRETKTEFTKHFLCIEFPFIKAQKGIIIIVKNPQIYTKANGLLQCPASKSLTEEKKSFLVKKGSVEITLTSPKNSYSYLEKIWFKIIVDRTKLADDLGIKSLELSINRRVSFNFKDNLKKSYHDMKNKILGKVYPGEKYAKLKKIEINDFINFPKNSEYLSVNPLEVYEHYNKTKLDDLDIDYKKINLFPSSRGTLISCEYYLLLEVKFEAKTTLDEAIELPIELYTPADKQSEVVPTAAAAAEAPVVVEEKVQNNEGAIEVTGQDTQCSKENEPTTVAEASDAVAAAPEEAK